MTTETLAALPTLGEEVSLRDVDRSLKRLWQSSAALTRASAMNFAIVSEQPGSLQANTNIISEVTREHACRAIVMAIEPSATAPQVRAWITAHCQVASGGRKSICSEQVTLQITGQSTGLIANTLFSNVDSDLPITLWWQGPFSPHWTPALYTEIDRLVIDSSEWADPLKEFAVLSSAREHVNSAFSVNDITWTRVLYMRMALASCFDNPQAMQMLPHIQHVELSHHPEHLMSARMFISWLADRARWQLAGREGRSFIFKNQSRAAVKLTLREHRGAPISQVRLTAPTGSITVERDDDSRYILGKVQGDFPAPEILVPCPADTQAELVVERLRRGGNTALYFKLLETVKALC